MRYLGVEVMYELYNPTILKIETIKLERRLDDDLSYLIDALPTYSTFDFHMEPVAHPAGTPVPINPLKVKLSLSTEVTMEACRIRLVITEPNARQL